MNVSAFNFYLRPWWRNWSTKRLGNWLKVTPLMNAGSRTCNQVACLQRPPPWPLSISCLFAGSTNLVIPNSAYPVLASKAARWLRTLKKACSYADGFLRVLSLTLPWVPMLPGNHHLFPWSIHSPSYLHDFSHTFSSLLEPPIPHPSLTLTWWSISHFTETIKQSEEDFHRFPPPFQQQIEAQSPLLRTTSSLYSRDMASAIVPPLTYITAVCFFWTIDTHVQAQRDLLC